MSDPEQQPEHHADDSATPPERLRPVRRIWYLLLILPFVATLVPPIYARQEPSIGGWPFFYWWQFAWVPVTAVILAVVYNLTTERVRPYTPERPARHRDGGDTLEGQGHAE